MTTPVAADQLRSYIERIERLNEEKAGIAESIKEVFSEAKGSGFDPKAMREVLKRRRMRKHELAELEQLVEVYEGAIGT